MDQKLDAYMTRHAVTRAARAAVTGPVPLFIDGALVTAKTDTEIPVFEPSTGAVLTTLAPASTRDVDRAVAAARHAFDSGPWPRMTPAERRRILFRLADLVETHADTLTEIEVLDSGKAIGPCRAVDILGSAELLRFMAASAGNVEGATRTLSSADHFGYTLKEPIGVVGAITPWNFPFNMAIWKCAAPLAVGCTVVLKTSEITPLSMTYFARLVQEAGLPQGVLNIVPGLGAEAGAHLAAHPGVDKMSFTGSTQTGVQVGRAAMGRLTPVTLELGGKSPMLAFADADLDALAEAARGSVFFSTGQNCSAGSRLYLHRDIYDDGVQALRTMLSGLTVTEGLDPACDIGPLVSAAHRDKVQSWIDLAGRDGEILHGGGSCNDPGYFVTPTLVAVADNAHPLMQEEIFGPVLAVMPFDTEDEAVQLANDSVYGLGASVWTGDGARAQRVLRRLDAGMVWVNCHDMLDAAMPFGGVKASGLGKDLGREQIEHVLRTKAVTLAL